MLLNRNKIQPVLELRAEYPGVCCVCAFFCAWRNMLVVQPVLEICAVNHIALFMTIYLILCDKGFTMYYEL